jgi:phenylalanine-4-hydroxylase
MKDTLIQYGVPVDPRLMVEPPDPDELEVDPKTPGIDDPAYMARRRAIFALTRRHRLENLGPPVFEYTADEARLWRDVSAALAPLHDAHACALYRKAKHDLAITSDAVPQMRTLSDRLRAETQTHLIPAEGSLAYRTFYRYIAARGFPVTQFLRHPSHPEFTPEPDMIHDCLGHVPPFMDRDYAELITLLGQAAAAATDGEHVLMLKRFSWFSIEFGLVEERGETKVFGAGILSSTGEIPNSLYSREVTRRPFLTADVVNTDYDPTYMQTTLFVAPSLKFLRAEAESLVKKLGILDRITG